MNKRYNDLNTYFRRIFKERVQKITVDAGFTCPNRDGTVSTGGCIFCNASGSGTGAYKNGISITDQILAGKKAMARRYKARLFLAYFQAFSNTYASPKMLDALYQEALSVDGVVGLSIGTRPDCVNESILNLLENFAKKYLIWVEYGLQSINDGTLNLINRGHDFRCFEDAVSLTKNRGIKICAHIILGLPGENKNDMLASARILSQMGIDGIKLHLLYVIKGTKLETMYDKGQYRCLEQKEYVDTICDYLELLPQEMIIQRLTGDPHPEELVAPEWAFKKSETLLMINETLKKRDSKQGMFLDNITQSK